VWTSLQLGIPKPFMNEHNITQTINNDQVFFQRWVTGSTIARWSEYAELNWKLSEKSFSLYCCEKYLHNQNTFNLVGKWKLINLQHLLPMMQSITSLTASYHSLNQASQSVLRVLLPFLHQKVPSSWSIDTLGYVRSLFVLNSSINALLDSYPMTWLVMVVALWPPVADRFALYRPYMV
jgi:hypothetical protein